MCLIKRSTNYEVYVTMKIGAGMDMNKPFLLKPAAKDYLWGGSRLNDGFNIGVDITHFLKHGFVTVIRMENRPRLMCQS